jgi:hypothetical protein
MEEEKRENHSEHSEHTEHHHKKSMTEKIRENPWVLSTFILGILTIILIGTTFSGVLTGNNVISKERAANNLVAYLDKSIDASITLVNVTEEAGLYLATVSYKGQSVPVYVTKDGSSYTTVLNTMTTSNPSSSSPSSSSTQTTVSKSDKPKVELYVFAYCPYGLQMEKAILPVVTLLGNSIDFSIRQIGAMHGDFEKVEAQRQLCIEKNYPSKYLAYISAFAADTSCNTGDTACVATKTNAIYSTLGINANTINTCIPADGLTLYNAEVSNANANGVSGSPTMFINGAEASPSARSPDAVKTLICSAFNNSPSSCSQTLDSNQASPGFGTSSSSSGSSGTQCATA